MQNCVVHCVCFINAARPCGFRAPRTAAHKYLLHHPAFPPRRRVHLNRGHLSIDPSVDRRERKRERREEKIGAKIDSRNWPRFLSSNRRSRRRNQGGTDGTLVLEPTIIPLSILPPSPSNSNLSHGYVNTYFSIKSRNDATRETWETNKLHRA